mmetsp:Transcript_14623/g.46697  ORF Transcript_14623/g.46697 Transcript_14623/m.46697 type:complete len:243 (+) Transcript_14623:633-1361(+)
MTPPRRPRRSTRIARPWTASNGVVAARRRARGPGRRGGHYRWCGAPPRHPPAHRGSATASRASPPTCAAVRCARPTRGARTTATWRAGLKRRPPRPPRPAPAALPLPPPPSTHPTTRPALARVAATPRRRPAASWTQRRTGPAWRAWWPRRRRGSSRSDRSSSATSGWACGTCRTARPPRWAGRGADPTGRSLRHRCRAGPTRAPADQPRWTRRPRGRATRLARRCAAWRAAASPGPSRVVP